MCTALVVAYIIGNSNTSKQGKKLEFKTKCPECDGDFQRLLCFKDELVVEPPPIPFEFSDNHEGWKYWLDHVREY